MHGFNGKKTKKTFAVRIPQGRDAGKMHGHGLQPVTYRRPVLGQIERMAVCAYVILEISRDRLSTSSSLAFLPSASLPSGKAAQTLESAASSKDTAAACHQRPAVAGIHQGHGRHDLALMHVFAFKWRDAEIPDDAAQHMLRLRWGGCGRRLLHVLSCAATSLLLSEADSSLMATVFLASHNFVR